METLNAILDLMAHPLPMLVFGMSCNLLLALAEESGKQGETVDVWTYVKGRRYRVPLGLIASLAGALILHQADQLTALSAFGVGYMGADVLDRIGAATGNRFAR